LEKELVSGSEVANLNTFVLNMRSYVADFTVKFTSGIFTDGKVLDTRVAVGALYTGTSGDKVMVGRIIKETQNTSVVLDELAGELKIDSLTDVYNKKTITDYAKKRLVEEKENKVIIAILDLDHFKSVNDNYGHMVGDKVLARAGRKLKEVVGNDGVVGRIGGDEFMIVFTGLNDDMTLRAMLRAVRTQIKWEFAEDFEGLSITCSIGASIFPTNGTDYEDLFKKADCCLYIAKEKGRDRYVFFRDELHRAEYEATLNGGTVKAMNSNRDVRELQYVSKFMRMAVESPQAAIKDALIHLVNSFGIDNVTVYYGDKPDRIFSYGTEISGIADGSFIHWKEFEKIEGANSNVAYVGHVSYIRSDYPKLSSFLKEAGVTSTIMCAIIKDGEIKGVVMFNKYKNEEAQWANYEIDCTAVFASYVGMLCVSGNQDVLTAADYNAVSQQAV
jgi:diguanylate cyclase (GGDEF)-like protein